ncbi:hypothetical protein pb186bvf_019875 [Paramecium bursaria]
MIQKQPQSQKYQQTINPRNFSDVWDNKIELLHKFYKLKFEQLGQEFQAEFDAFMATSRQLIYGIVGLTVIGCAKYAKYQDKLKFGIMIIEEAAEVLESHTIAILSKNVEHLILISDHQQLRPKLENNMIEKKYKTNISLFQRLINNGINFVTLSNQRRMRTDFANIIRLIYGNEYQDYHQTYKQNQVQIKGLKHNLVFFYHQNNEKNHLDFQSSKCNEFESGMITNLVKYLIANEYASTQQLFYLFQDIKKQFLKERITGVKIQTAANYQGEENDIIILSLVRSNNKMQLGFVGIDSRVLVALSRARIGLYVFGDFQFIKSSAAKNIIKNRNNNSDLWIRIINHVKQSKNLIEQLVLQCQSHQTETIITKLPEWRNSVHGGVLTSLQYKSNSKCGECFDNIHNFCQTKVPGKYGQNVYCGQDIQNRSQTFFSLFQKEPDINNILKPLRQNQNQQVKQFYQNIMNKNIAFNITYTQSIILEKQIDLIIKLIQLIQTIVEAKKQKIQILNNILFRDDLYLRASYVYLDQLSLSIDKLKKPNILFQRGTVQSNW